MAAKKRNLSAEALAKMLKRRRSLCFVFIAIALSSLTALPQFADFKFFYSLEQSVLSLRYALRGKADINQDKARIVVVGIDEASLNPGLSEEDLNAYPQAEYLMEPWPWNRAVHGFVAQRLRDAGASVVAFDFIFPTPNPGDWEFYEAIEAHPGHIVLGYDYVPAENELGETFIQERLPYDDLLPMEGGQQLLCFVNIHRDSDGILRRAKLKTNLYNENIPFIEAPDKAERIAKLAARSQAYLSLGAQAAVLHDPSVRDTIPPMMEFPVINYGGQDYFPMVSYADIILDDRFEAQKELFQNAIVFVGPYSDFFKDISATPIGDMFGVETHAHITRSLLNQAFYHPVAYHWQLLINVVLAAVLLLGNLIFKPALQKSGWTFFLVASCLVLSQIAFSEFHLLFQVVPILWILLGCGAIFLVYDFSIAQYERSMMRNYLSRYVSSEVADLLAEDSAGLESLLKGANRPIAVLFSDIRGFTSISESYHPVDLVEFLNEYFESMVDGIHAHRGLLNKYIGDAILAVWGGLYSDGPQQDCLGVVRAGMDMEKRMDALNRRWQDDPERESLHIGIGIHHGNAFVGNLGHPNRMEFAVMGDVVNLGSRLEGATKQYGCSILVSEQVYQHCQFEIRFFEIDKIQVKGKTEGIRTFSPINRMDEPEPGWLATWNEALKAYRNREFEQAKITFSRLAQDEPKLAKAAKLYIERCDILIDDPPSADWDFVFVMQTK